MPSLNAQLATLVDHFDADVIMRLDDVPSTTYKARAKVNASLMDAFDAPVLYDFAQEVPGKCAVLWMEAQDVPTKGSRGVVRRALLGARVEPSAVSHVWALPEGRVGADLPLRIARYLPWTMSALANTGVRHVLLVGRAAWLWRADMKPSDCAGRWFLWNSKYMVMCVGDPANNGGDVHETNKWHRHMTAFGVGVQEYTQLEAVSARECMKCRNGVYVYDADGIPYCRDHAKQGMLDYETQRKRWQQATKQASQQGLL